MADRELSSISEAAERVAIRHAQEKLETVGWQLGTPHSSARSDPASVKMITSLLSSDDDIERELK
jgi:hypothetical protein